MLTDLMVSLITGIIIVQDIIRLQFQKKPMLAQTHSKVRLSGVGSAAVLSMFHHSKLI